MTRRLTAVLAIGAAAMLALTACSSGEPSANEAPADSAPGGAEPLRVVTSFTILEDMAKEIGGDLVEVHNLVPIGTDPHEYEPLPEDTKAVADAEVLFANGLNLEGGDDGWFARLLDSVGQDPDRVFEVSEQIEPMRLGGVHESDEEINPHSFIDPENGILIAEAIRDGLQDADPEHAEDYAASADAYLQELREIADEYEERLGAIPEEERVLVTSERAFQYLAARYGLTEGFLWEIDTDENGSAAQITALVDFLKTHPVRALVVESNVDARPMETVSEESGVPIYEEPIFSDEIGGPPADTYVKYLRYNLDVIEGALAGTE